MTLRRVAHLLRALFQQRLQHAAHVVRRAAHEEVVRGRAPRLAQPREVRFEPAARHHHAFRRDAVLHALAHHRREREAAVAKLQVRDFRLVRHLDAERLRRSVIRVDQRLAPAEEERVGAPEVQRAAEGRLETHAVTDHPRQVLRGIAYGAPREALIGEAAGDLEQVVPVLVLRVRVRHGRHGARVHRAHVARVPAVAAAHGLGRRLDDRHARARFTRGNGGA
jgi:hypothetical protein